MKRTRAYSSGSTAHLFPTPGGVVMENQTTTVAMRITCISSNQGSLVRRVGMTIRMRIEVLSRKAICPLTAWSKSCVKVSAKAETIVDRQRREQGQAKGGPFVLTVCFCESAFFEKGVVTLAEPVPGMGVGKETQMKNSLDAVVKDLSRGTTISGARQNSSNSVFTGLFGTSCV